MAGAPPQLPPPPVIDNGGMAGVVIPARVVSSPNGVGAVVRHRHIFWAGTTWPVKYKLKYKSHHRSTFLLFKTAPKSGFEMCFSSDTFGVGGQNTSRIQNAYVYSPHLIYRLSFAAADAAGTPLLTHSSSALATVVAVATVALVVTVVVVGPSPTVMGFITKKLNIFNGFMRDCRILRHS